jgi:hypothetical protein
MTSAAAVTAKLAMVGNAIDDQPSTMGRAS